LNTSLLITAAAQPPARQPIVAAEPPNIEVVITGTGCVTRLGAGTAQLLAGTAGEDAKGYLDWFDINRWYDPAENLSYQNRAAQLAAAAAAIAVDESGLSVTSGPYAPERIAVIAGTYLGGGPEASEVLCRALLKKPEAIRPSMSLDHGVHLGAALVIRELGLTGVSYTLSGSMIAGLQAIAVARDLLICGRADVAVVLAYDAIDHLVLKGQSLLGCHACQLAEGAAALVLEAKPEACQRGASVHATLGQSAFTGRLSGGEDGWGRAAARLARGAPGESLDTLHSVCGPGCSRLIDGISAHLGQGIEHRNLQSATGCCLAADSMLATVWAITRRASALVVAAEESGAAGALVVHAKEPQEDGR
jgi:hypothetical protein